MMIMNNNCEKSGKSVAINFVIPYIDIIVSQNRTQFYAQYVQYISQLHVSAHFRPCLGRSL